MNPSVAFIDFGNDYRAAIPWVLLSVKASRNYLNLPSDLKTPASYSLSAIFLSISAFSNSRISLRFIRAT